MVRKILAIGLVLLLSGVPAFAATITFVAATSDTSDATTYTFTNHAIGTASADRCVVVKILGRRGAATVTTVDAVTIGGVSATVVKQLSVEEAGAANIFAVASLTVAAGTTATIAVTFSAALLRARISVSAMTGVATCTTLADSEESEAADPTFSLDVPDEGSAVSVCGAASGGAVAWTGLTETDDAVLESVVVMSSAEFNFSTQQTGLTVTCDLSVSTSGEGGIAVSWAPATGGASAPGLIGAGVF